MHIYSVFHKPYWCPNDELYIPIQVGFADNIKQIGKRMLRDNTGDNIATKNKTFCELTAYYWVWKNRTEDFVGFDHYRRHFCLKKKKDKRNAVITKTELINHISPNVIILPKKRHYWIETNYSQYIHAHNAIDLIKTREIIELKYPEYLSSYDSVMKKTSGHRFNMMISPWDIFDSYCCWLFDILFELEKVLDISEYTEKDQRVFGYISERLLDVYIDHNNIKVKELNYVFMDKEKWGKKILSFIARKCHKHE